MLRYVHLTRKMACFNYTRNKLLLLGRVCLADNVLPGSTFTIIKSLGLLRAGRGFRAGRSYELKTIKQKSKIDSWISDGRRYANFGQIGRSPETTRTKRTIVKLINITSTTSELTKKQVPGFCFSGHRTKWIWLFTQSKAKWNWRRTSHNLINHFN